MQGQRLNKVTQLFIRVVGLWDRTNMRLICLGIYKDGAKIDKISKTRYFSTVKMLNCTDLESSLALMTHMYCLFGQSIDTLILLSVWGQLNCYACVGN